MIFKKTEGVNNNQINIYVTIQKKAKTTKYYREKGNKK